MSWIVYFAVFAICIALPLFIVSLKSKPIATDSPFDRESTAFLKGIAIVLVGCCHYMGKFGNGTVYFTPLGGIGVAMFLVMSGYGLSESWTPYSQSVKVERERERKNSAAPELVAQANHSGYHPISDH